MRSAAAVGPGGSAQAGIRWAVPAALLAAEYLLLSVRVDLPMTGPAMAAVRPLRTLGPVLFAAAAAGWLIARGEARGRPGALPPLPAWRPWPALAAQAGAYAVTAAWALALFRPGAAPASPGAVAAWLVLAAATGLLALRSAAPLRWLVALAARRWLVPLAAISVGFLAWRAAAAAEGLWGLLSAFTLHAAGAVASAAGVAVRVDAARSVLWADAVRIEIAPICSGVDGVGLVVLFQAVWIALARERLRWQRALLLLPVGAAAALAGNVLRVAVLALLAAHGRPDLAFGGFHSKLGWAFFIAVALGSVAVAERSRWLARPAGAGGGAAASEGVPPGAGAYVAPFVATLAAALATSMLAAGGLDRLYGLRIAAGAAVLLAVRSRLPRAALAPALVPLAAGLAVGAGWIALAGGDGAAVADALGRLAPGERAAWIAVRVAGACVLVPLVEELAFRGFLLPWLVSPGFRGVPPRAWSWPAAAGSSLAFGAIHSEWLLGAAAGLAFAGVRRWRGRLGDAVLAHAVANAAIGAAVLAGGRWGLWGG